MLQVLVCLPQPEEAKLVFDYTTSVVKDLKTRCEIYCSANYEIIRQKLVDNFYSYDILLLEALDRGCLAIAEFLRSRNFIGSIIFIAKDSAKISNIFIYRPSYLVTKLEDDRQIRSAMFWAYNEQIKARPYFSIKNKDEILRIHHADILWFESRQRIVILHSRNQEVSFYAKLSDVYEILPKELFIRCHQSYVVNCDKITRVDKVNRRISLVTGDVIEISKSYYAQMMAFMDMRDLNK
ncbi:MAG: LytTR family transcriptional regulator [Clostridiaceae bacterium]|nr:LytTR family transcriptional regulator [Clostridiaceae bacterium]HPU45056.1 LytTR family DNA-binding domain-containing protein [Thermoclostridium sp.]